MVNRVYVITDYVIPAKAGIHPCTHRNVWAKMDSRLRGNDNTR